MTIYRQRPTWDGKELTRRYAEPLGVSCVILTPDPDDSRMVHVDTDVPVTPGAAQLLRMRAWMAVVDHRRYFNEPAAVLNEPWTVRRGPTGRAWIVEHDGCGRRIAA